MNERLAIKIGEQYLALPGDFSIDIEDVNPLFNDSESFSYEVEVPMETNRHIMKDIDNICSDKRLVNIENQDMRIIAEGIPFRSGRLRTREDQEIGETISISLVSSVKILSDLIADKNCQDIPVKDKIKIGEMVGEVYAEFGYNYRMECKSSGKSGFLSWSSTKKSTGKSSETVSNKFNLQALGFSTPKIYRKKPFQRPEVIESFINVSDEYPYKPYCNARVCYTHYKKDADGKSGNTVSTTEKYDPYYVLDADRPQSGICFYVLYFLDCLFASLGIVYHNDRLLTVGDMKRLVFFTTHCKYDLERKYPEKGDDVYDFDTISSINSWLSSQGTKGKIDYSYEKTKDIEGITVKDNSTGKEQYYTVGSKLPNGETLKSAHFIVEEPSVTICANRMNMYANSLNFPNVSVSTILDSFWAQFGIKFIMDYEERTVTPIYIREVFRDTSTPIKLHCQMLTATKVSEKITGVRMKYATESDETNKRDIIKSNSKDYNTDYDYSDYSKVDATKHYLEIIKKQASTDTTCYIDTITGNAYRLKVNADATTVSELKPALFEVGGYSGVELGDCSIENEEFIIEMISDFQPVIPNDVNGRYEKQVGGLNSNVLTSNTAGCPDITISNVNSADNKQILAVFVDEDMWHENIEFRIKNVIGSDHADFYIDAVLTTDECYDPSNTDDGNSPLQSHDWGLTLCIMRGGGADARIVSYDHNYDGNGNSKWRMTAGEYAMSSDSLDNWGSEYDYNGVNSGVGDDERFSLKIRAYKEVNGSILCEADRKDTAGNVETKVRSRGSFDTFLSEYAHFLMNRKKVALTFRCEIAELVDIQWQRRYDIGGYIGWINKINSSISMKNGIGIVEAEMYIL